MSDTIPSPFSLWTGESVESLPTVIDWNLVQSIDPLLLPHSETKRSYSKFLHDLPLYKVTSRDAKILSHPLAVRFFLIAQAAIADLTTHMSILQQTCKKQASRLVLLSDQLDLERTHHETTADRLRHTEKCVTCGKRFLTLANLDAHVARRHPALLISWQKLRSDDFLDEDTERIAVLKAEINTLKSQMRPPPPAPPPPPPPRKPMTPVVTSFAVQPTVGPCIRATAQFSPASSELGTGPVYDAIVGGEDAIAAQAHRKARRAKRQFDTVRECLRVRLAHAVPLPDALQSDAGSVFEHRGEPPARPATASQGSAESAHDPFLLSPAEAASERTSSSPGVMPVLITDSEDDASA
jgi:hypothetical protein